MKKLILVTSLTLVLSVQAFAQEVKVRTISDYTMKTIVDLNETTVRCSALGYGSSQLKVSVPGLDGVTFFDHSNVGEAVSCMTAGRCEHPLFNTEGLKPSDILDILNPKDEMEIRIVLEETMYLDRVNGKCHRSIAENLEGELRGLSFTHTRSKSIGTVDITECE